MWAVKNQLNGMVEWNIGMAFDLITIKNDEVIVANVEFKLLARHV